MKIVQRKWWMAVLSLVILLALAACGGDDDGDENEQATPEAAAPGLTVRDAWVRATAPMTDEDAGMEATGQVTGAFLVIENGSDTAERLVRAEVSADIAGTVELHETTMVDDVMQMRPVEGIDVPAQGSAELKPGSFHVMLLDVKKDLNPGDTVALTLVFESGQTLSVDAEVRELETMP